MRIPTATVVFNSGSGGTVDPSGTIPDIAVGIADPLSAFANDDYIFSSWTYSGSMT
jgi:hypothetical protein